MWTTFAVAEKGKTMICEKCGKEINSLLVDIFNRDGTDDFYEHPITEYEENAVTVDVNPNWTGSGLSEEEMMDTIACPYCKAFPFEHKEVQTYEFVRLVCFKKDTEHEQ